MSQKLGSLEASEQLITDLYIELRRKINSWAQVTHQTAQARMGYVGQHLVSVVTGYPGGKSGARGKDLILNNNDHAEIKTCYRVDQLGKCNDCGAVVASIEVECSFCDSKNICRNDDSKWLIGIRHDDEFNTILEPKYYYLVLFDFVDLYNPDTVRSSIWEVDSKSPGFAYAMVDYYLNIRSKSSSKAPFNLWPFQLKFDLMKAKLIYRSFIKNDDTIDTEIFPGRDHPIPHLPDKIYDYRRSRNLTLDKIESFSSQIGCALTQKTKSKIITELDNYISSLGGFDYKIVDLLAKELYWNEITEHLNSLPKKLRATMVSENLI